MHLGGKQVCTGVDPTQWCSVFLCAVNVGQATFEALAQIVRRVHELLEDKNDHNGRNSVLASYIQYCCTLPHQGLLHQCWFNCVLHFCWNVISGLLLIDRYGYMWGCSSCLLIDLWIARQITCCVCLWVCMWLIYGLIAVCLCVSLSVCDWFMDWLLCVCVCLWVCMWLIYGLIDWLLCVCVCPYLSVYVIDLWIDRLIALCVCGGGV